jgi:hypothetical protein
MQLKKLQLGLAGTFITFAIFCAGYTAGKNRAAKRELNVSIPFHVHVYRSIKKGDLNKAAGLTSMMLMGKLSRYDSLTNNLFFRLTAGTQLFDSITLQKYVAEAREITRAEKTNLVTLGPETNE